MADSTLDPTLEPVAEPRKKRGTAELGPSGTSDSGSDLQGPGLAAEEALLFDTGTTSDIERSAGAGHDVGDANLDSDTDEGGTGEAASAGRDDDAATPRDIAPDRIIGTDLPMPADALDRIAVDEKTPESAEDSEESAESAESADSAKAAKSAPRKRR